MVWAENPNRTNELEPDVRVEPDMFGDFSVGRYLWFLKDVVKLDEPIAAVGRQGIWNWEINKEVV